MRQLKIVKGGPPDRQQALRETHTYTFSACGGAATTDYRSIGY
jgi:hypothetical protein